MAPRRSTRIHFALNCGARSCPPVAIYAPETLDEQFDAATRAYLEAETEVDTELPQVSLPRLMRIYRADFGRRREQLRFAARFLPELAERVRAGDRRLRVRYGRFDWTAAEVSGSAGDRRAGLVGGECFWKCDQVEP